LPVTGGRVVKGVNFVNLLDAGTPWNSRPLQKPRWRRRARLLDITASSDAREIMADVVARTARKAHPARRRGGIRSIARRTATSCFSGPTSQR